MQDFLDIFSDVLLIASFQPRQRERRSADPHIGVTHRATFASPQRRFEGLERH
jgi:hypothetical protein